MGVPESAPAVVVDFDGGLMDGSEEEYEDGDDGGRGTETTEEETLASHIVFRLATRFRRPTLFYERR